MSILYPYFYFQLTFCQLITIYFLPSQNEIQDPFFPLFPKLIHSGPCSQQLKADLLLFSDLESNITLRRFEHFFIMRNRIKYSSPGLIKLFVKFINAFIRLYPTPIFTGMIIHHGFPVDIVLMTVAFHQA